MLGTWGIRSINTTTFNQCSRDNLTYPKEIRDIIYTGLKIRNLVLNVLGYIPAVRMVSGCVRIGLGLTMLAGVLAVGERHAKQGVIIGRFYDEALSHAMAQITRGVFEAFVPYGFVVNAVLDVVGTVVNIGQEIFWEGHHYSVDDDYAYTPEAHPNPDYPIPANLLHLV